MAYHSYSILYARQQLGGNYIPIPDVTDQTSVPQVMSTLGEKCYRNDAESCRVVPVLGECIALPYLGNE